MKTISLLRTFFGFALLLSGCIVTPATLIPDTPVPLITTIAPTATTVWFPPTATSTIIPTLAITPTVDLKPKIGALIFTDDFSVNTNWMLAQSNVSSVAMGVNEITLAILQPKTYLYTLRKQPQVDNFYLEITASPNLCLGDDEYGILFRFTPNQEFYRLGLTCDGQLHLDRYMQNRAAMIYPKSYSGAVPPGAPSLSSIAIWALKNEIIVFINQQYQFTLNDGKIPSGAFGLFARTGTHDALTVNFSDLKVYQIK